MLRCESSYFGTWEEGMTFSYSHYRRRTRFPGLPGTGAARGPVRDLGGTA